MEGGLALRHHRSFSATSYCWLSCSEGSICRVDKVLNMTRCSWVAEDVCSIRSDADLAQFRQQVLRVVRGIEDKPIENVQQFLVCDRHHITHPGGDPIEKDGGAAYSGLFSTGTK